MHSEDVGHRGGPSNDCKISFIEILEGLLLRFAPYLPHNRLRGIRALLHRNLRNARQRLSIPVQSECQISEEIDIRIIGDCEVGPPPNGNYTGPAWMRNWDNSE